MSHPIYKGKSPFGYHFKRFTINVLVLNVLFLVSLFTMYFTIPYLPK